MEKETEQVKKQPKLHSCAFGILIPMRMEGSPTHYQLYEFKTKKRIGSKLRCTHGIVAKHCKNQFCINKYHVNKNSIR